MDGYFVLGRAALQAVKQWHFRPYVVNGRALETQTILTVNFRLPVVSGVPQPGESNSLFWWLMGKSKTPPCPSNDRRDEDGAPAVMVRVPRGPIRQRGVGLFV